MLQRLVTLSMCVMRVILCVIVGCGATIMIMGCATGPYGLEIRHAGKLDPSQNQAAIEKAQALPWEGVYPVDVYMDTLPPGLTKDEATKAIKIAPDAEERIALVGVARSYQEHTRWVTQIRGSISSRPCTQCTAARATLTAK